MASWATAVPRSGELKRPLPTATTASTRQAASPTSTHLMGRRGPVKCLRALGAFGSLGGFGSSGGFGGFGAFGSLGALTRALLVAASPATPESMAAVSTSAVTLAPAGEAISCALMTVLSAARALAAHL